MPRSAVNVAGNNVIVNFDNASFLAMRWWGLARFQTIDELTRRPITVPQRLTVHNGKLIPRVSTDGLVGVVGRPWDVLNPLERDEVALDLRVTTPGYHERRLNPRVRVRRFQLTLIASADVLSMTPAPVGLRVGQRLIVGSSNRFEYATIRSVDLLLNRIFLTGNVTQTYVPGPGVFVIPDEFAVDASAQGTAQLHRQRVILTGRVTENAATPTPMAGAEVRVREVWRLAPQVGAAPPPDGPQAPWQPPVALLNAPMYSDFPVAGTEVRMQNRAFDGAVATKQLMARASFGTNESLLNDASGISAGDVIALDAGDAEREELLEVGNVTPTARLQLVHALRFDHPPGALVRRLLPFVGVAPLRGLTHEALAHDEVLLLDMTPGSSEGQVEVFHPGPPPVRTYHRLRRYAVTTNADGVFHLPIARTSRLVVAAFGPAPTFSRSSAPVLLEPNYAVTESHLDCFVP